MTLRTTLTEDAECNECVTFRVRLWAFDERDGVIEQDLSYGSMMVVVVGNWIVQLKALRPKSYGLKLGIVAPSEVEIVREEALFA